MGTVSVNGKAREATIEATILRADGRVEHLGAISYWHRNPLRRLAWHLFGWRG
jgi:hypothetical protein